MKTLIISDSDLDGHSASVLIARYLLDETPDYVHTDHTSIDNTFKEYLTHPHDYQQIVISDLSLSRNSVGSLIHALSVNPASVEKVYWIDHHQYEQRTYLDLFEQLAELGIGLDAILSDRLSATGLVAQKAVRMGHNDMGLLVHGAHYVSAYDTHDYTVYERFLVGQLLEDYYKEASKAFEFIAEAQTSGSQALYDKLMRLSSQALMELAGSASEDSLQGPRPDLDKGLEVYDEQISTSFPRRLIELAERYIPGIDASKIEPRGHRQMLAQIAAIAYYTQYQNHITQVETDKGCRILVMEAPLPSRVLFYWESTLKAADIYAVIHQGDRVELRQTKRKYWLDLSRLARDHFDGGGHPYAAGFPLHGQVTKSEIAAHLQRYISLKSN